MRSTPVNSIIIILNKDWPSWYLLHHRDGSFIRLWCAHKQFRLRGRSGNDFRGSKLRKTFLVHAKLVTEIPLKERFSVFETNNS